MEPLGIALIGCGTVGSGVARLLLEQRERLAARAGRPLQLRRVVVREPSKPRPVPLPPELITTDLRTVLDDPEVQIAVEVVGGTGWARQAVLDLLATGKHVVTANKALLAHHGEEVFNTARKYNRSVGFEASVAGGIPIIAAITENLAANQIISIQGILNGTSNFILTAMSERGESYAEAQRLGYAEADPTLDVDGTDAAHKLAILAQLAFGVMVQPEEIPRKGIARVTQADIHYADELGYTIKLLAEAWLDTSAPPSPVVGESSLSTPSSLVGELALHVSPVLLRHHDLMAQVRGAYNAIHLIGDAVGDTIYYGKGAGQMPTASAVVADIIDLAIGRAQKTFQTLRLWSGNHNTIVLRPASRVRSRWYLRLQVEDRPGVLAEIATVLARHQISIMSVIQHEPLSEYATTVPLIIMTHHAATSVFADSVAELERLKCVTAPSIYYPVAD